jgi:predicted acyltransferase
MLPTKTEPVLATPLSKIAASSRLASIDILRAVTMVLMIFVNDLWSLVGIPAWLEHVSYEADGMGLADTIFPAFLFIVGMSIPFAIQSRQKKGDTTAGKLYGIF